jgi:GABA permease
MRLTGRGVPANAILFSSIVGFLCIIAAAFSEKTIFAFLLNSSGAIILFVYILIAISQIVLRYRNKGAEFRMKMWLFPVLSILTALAILAILVQMGIQADVRSQLVLSVLSWAVVLVFYFANKQFISRRPVPAGVAAVEKPHRVLVVANETANSGELLDELRRIGADTTAKYFVVVPASPIETGVAATHGPLDLAEATQQAAQQRLDYTLTTLRSDNLDADGALGDYRPLRALANAVKEFNPDQIVIATLPPEYSVWHRFDIVDRARAEHGLPVTHVVATPVVTAAR